MNATYIYNVCTFPYKPYVYCDTTGREKLIFGFYVDIFETIAKHVGISYILKCMEHADFLRQIRMGFNSTYNDTKPNCNIFI